MIIINLYNLPVAFIVCVIDTFKVGHEIENFTNQNGKSQSISAKDK